MARQRNPYSTEDFNLGGGVWNPYAQYNYAPDTGYEPPPPVKSPVPTPAAVPPGPTTSYDPGTPAEPRVFTRADLPDLEHTANLPDDLDAYIQDELARFRDEAAQQGLRVDAGDAAAYQQMLAGFGSLKPWASYDANNDGQPDRGPEDENPQPQSPTSPTAPTPQPEVDFATSVRNSLQGLFNSGGGFNQDIVNRRTDIARDTLNRQRTSRLATNRAAMAERGLLSAPGAPSGAEATMLSNLEGDLGNQFAGAYSGIFADESRAADQRMMQALQIGAGMSMEEARRAVEQFRAETDRMLGQGNLALNNSRNANDYNLGLGRLGLDRDRLLAEMDYGDIDRIIKLLEQLYGGAGTSAGGYV